MLIHLLQEPFTTPLPPDAIEIERVDCLFRLEQGLDREVFPGAALRGLIGRAVGDEEEESPTIRSFFRERFKPGENGVVSWRMEFHHAPDPQRRRFSVRLSTIGKHARDDLASILAALRVCFRPLKVGEFESRIALERVDSLDARLVVPWTTRPPASWTAEVPEGPLRVDFITPVSIHRGGRPLPAAEWSDATPLFDSVRLRVADLAGKRHREMPSLGSPPVAHLSLTDVEIPLVLDRRPRTLRGVMGYIEFEQLDAGHFGLLQAAASLGAGRLTSYGLGTLSMPGLNA